MIFDVSLLSLSSPSTPSSSNGMVEIDGKNLHNNKLPNWTIYRLRQDSQLLQSRAINWSQDFQTQNHLNGSTISISSSTGNINNECTESTSSTETLKWLGSMSDVSVVSQATNTSTLSGKY